MNFLNGSIWRISFFFIFFITGRAHPLKMKLLTYITATRHFAFFLFPSRSAATETELDLRLGSQQPPEHRGLLPPSPRLDSTQ